MTQASGPCPPAIGGLVLAAAVALWWMASTRLALDDGSDASHRAVGMLLALWLLRGMALALLSLRAGALHGWRVGMGHSLALIAPAWPLLVLAWNASTLTLTKMALAEGLLLLAGAVLPLLGHGVGRVLRRLDLAEATATLLGTGLAAALWCSSGLWALPLGL